MTWKGVHNSTSMYIFWNFVAEKLQSNKNVMKKRVVYTGMISKIDLPDVSSELIIVSTFNKLLKENSGHVRACTFGVI